MKFWLVLQIAFPSHGSTTVGGSFDKLDDCLRAVEKAQIVIPSNNSENEWAGFKVCLPEENAKATYPQLRAPLVSEGK